MNPATTDTRRFWGPAHGALPSRHHGKLAGLRAAFLLVVWALPTVWCAGHQLAHPDDADDHGVHLSVSVEERTAELYERHEHGHTHPEEPPAVSNGGAKKLELHFALAAAIELRAPTTSVRWQRQSVLGNAPARASAAACPRAPPIA